MKSFFRNIVLSFVRRIYPIIKQVYAENEAHTEELLVRSFASCGENFQVGAAYRIEGCKYIRLGDSFSAGNNLRAVVIDHYGNQFFSPQLLIGNNVRIEDNCHIGCIEHIEIGDGTLIASKVFISDHFHGNVDTRDIGIAPSERILTSKPVKIGKNVWIGDGVCIMPGVVLGDNVIVGANAVVTHSFPENSVIVGCPAKLLKTLNEKTN